MFQKVCLFFTKRVEEGLLSPLSFFFHIPPLETFFLDLKSKNLTSKSKFSLYVYKCISVNSELTFSFLDTPYNTPLLLYDQSQTPVMKVNHVGAYICIFLLPGLTNGFGSIFLNSADYSLGQLQPRAALAAHCSLGQAQPRAGFDAHICVGDVAAQIREAGG